MTFCGTLQNDFLHVLWAECSHEHGYLLQRCYWKTFSSRRGFEYLRNCNYKLNYFQNNILPLHVLTVDTQTWAFKWMLLQAAFSRFLQWTTLSTVKLNSGYRGCETTVLVNINLDQGAAHSNHYSDYPDVNQSRQRSFSVLNNVDLLMCSSWWRNNEQSHQQESSLFDFNFLWGVYMLSPCPLPGHHIEFLHYSQV